MAALPYIPLFVADYLADTAHLTTVQHGAYLLLIMNYWQRGGPLPNDDSRLARIVGMSARNWQQVKAPIMEFFDTGNDSGPQFLHHHRIDRELDRVASKSLKSKKAAQASVKRRFGERPTGAERTLNHTQAQAEKVPLDKSNGAEPDQVFWANGKAFIAGETKGDPGKLIGAWCRDYGKPATAQAITKAQLERPAQRIPFIIGCLKLTQQEDVGWNGMA